MSIEEEIKMALSQADVLAGLKEIVEEVAGVSPSLIELDKNFTDDLDVDSLSMVEVVVAAEERFGVKIPDEAVTDLATVGDAVNFIVNAAK
jgi:acyl carrier protein